MQPVYNQHLTSIAESDIDKIIDFYIENGNIQAALDFLELFEKSLFHLIDNPYMGCTRRDLTRQDVRFFTMKWGHYIIYQPTNPIKVIRILDSRQDVTSLLHIL